jgi:Zn-dependent peptidase ImmA (M78 family)
VFSSARHLTALTHGLASDRKLRYRHLGAMTGSVLVPVRPSLLVWARTRAGLEVKDLERKIPRYRDWESGAKTPTLRQLEDFARRTHAPLGYLFLDAPPHERLPVTDFRTLGVRELRPSPDLLETIYAVQRRRDFVRDILIEDGAAPLPFVGSVSLATPIEDVVREMRSVLALPPGWARSYKDWRDALRVLRERMESAGIVVLTNGVVGNNTRRRLRVEEFRGFVLIDRNVPVIFLNAADAESARMFTLVHEAAHVWLGAEGVSGFEELVPGNNAVERHCDAVAAEFLVPGAELRATWPRVSGANNDRCSQLSRAFKVSPLVVARRARDLGFLDPSEFSSLYRMFVSRVAQKRTGGNFYATAGVRLGQRFPELIYAAVRAGRLSWTDAYDLTDLRGQAFTKFGQERGYLP